MVQKEKDKVKEIEQEFAKILASKQVIKAYFSLKQRSNLYSNLSMFLEKNLVCLFIFKNFIN